MALSPDGQTLAFVGTSEGVARIWLRRLGEQEGHPLLGTEDVQGLTWSADGRSVAFGTSRLIKKVLIGGGTAEVVSEGRVGTTSRFAWGPDGTLVFSDTRGLWRVTANGGTAVIAARDAGVTYESPHFLPDGRHFLVAAASADAAKAGTFVLSLDDSSKTRLLALPTPARYAMGRLLYVRDRTLYAQPFDASRLELTGEAVALAPNVAPTFASSNQGTMAVLPLGPADQPDLTQLVWMSRDGRVAKRFEEAGGARRPSLSPDGRRVAVNLRSAIWVIDLARGIQSRVALGIVGNGAVWSPDNQRLIFNRSNYQSKGMDAMFETLVANIGSETMVREPVDQHAHPTDVSSDGKILFYEGGTTDSPSGLKTWPAIERPSRTRRRRRSKRKACCRRMATGSRTRRICRADSRFMCKAFPSRE